MEKTFLSFTEAIQRLKEALEEPKTELNRDAAIQRFEFAFELSWKVIQKFIKSKGVSCSSPNNCFRDAYKIGIISDSPIWFQMAEDRNLTVHTYDRQLAAEVFGRLDNYLALFQELVDNLKAQLPSFAPNSE